VNNVFLWLQEEKKSINDTKASLKNLFAEKIFTFLFLPGNRFQ